MDLTINCPLCNAVIPSFSKFCMVHGGKISEKLSASKECSMCGNLSPEKAFYCIKCGTPIKRTNNE